MLRGTLICLATCVFVAAEGASAAEPPATRPATSTPATTKAATRAIITLEETKAKYEKTIKSVREQYLRELTELKRRAIVAESLEEANALAEEIRRIERDPTTPLRTKGGKTIAIKASKDWQPTTVSVHKGDVLDITATGQWTMNERARGETTYGPDGLRAGGQADFHGIWAILLARVGPKIYLIGKGARVTADHDGVLELRCNDFNLNDNLGSVQVTIVTGE